MRATHLRTEYMTTPLGIDITKPRFYWNCEGGAAQRAYRITASRAGKQVWDSGVVESAAMTHIRYQGETLGSRDRVTWSVCLMDESESWGETAESWFELGLLAASDWSAKWISGNYRAKRGMRYAPDCFRTQFILKDEIRSARLYATARGVYDVSINGMRLTDFVLAPGVTDYRRRIQYQTYDVTALLRGGTQNCLELRLADGWFRGSVAAYGVTQVFGTQTAVMAQLEVTYADGSTECIGTDENFAWSSDGPLRFADLKDGEVCDANRMPTYAGRAVISRSIKKAAAITAANNVPVTEHERLTARQCNPADADGGCCVLDFGQNLAGYLEFYVKGKKGQRLRMTLGEVLDGDGRVDLSGIQESRPKRGWSQLSLIKKLLGAEIKGETERTPKQEITFVMSGGEDYYKTSFAVFGFRYVQIEGEELARVIRPENFTAIAVYSDMEQTGAFSCSSELVNRLCENTLWSMKSNFLDVPTDCPTRERLGWTGDAQIFFDTGAYMMDVAAFFRKWMRDMEDGQYKNGLLSATVPYEGVEMMYRATGASVGWADAVYLVPYRFYKRYGDLEQLAACYPMIKKYTDYLMANLGMTDKKAARANPYNDYTYEKGVHLGEWLEPEEFRDQVYGARAKHPEECTAYLYLAMHTMEEIARLVGDDIYAGECARFADGAKKAYKALFADTGLLETNRQAKLVRPLAFGLLEGADKDNAKELLKKAIRNYDFCVGTGFLSTPFLLPVLTAAGTADLAYRVLENTKKPGWLGEVLDGATTIWENWEGTFSRNHYSPGAVCQWLFDSVCGIRPDGERHFVIAPTPGGTLTFARASYRSIYGTVESGWEKMADGICVTVRIPANVTAELALPDGSVHAVMAGEHRYLIKDALKTGGDL